MEDLCRGGGFGKGVWEASQLPSAVKMVFQFHKSPHNQARIPGSHPASYWYVFDHLFAFLAHPWLFWQVEKAARGVLQHPLTGLASTSAQVDQEPTLDLPRAQLDRPEDAPPPPGVEDWLRARRFCVLR